MHAEHQVLATFGRDVPVDAATRRAMAALQRAWERDWPLARDLIVGLARAWGAQRLAQEWPTIQACVLNVSDEAEAGAVLREVLGVFARSRAASTSGQSTRARARTMLEARRAEEDLAVYSAIAKSHLAVRQIVSATKATADAKAEALATSKAATAALGRWEAEKAERKLKIAAVAGAQRKLKKATTPEEVREAEALLAEREAAYEASKASTEAAKADYEAARATADHAKETVGFFGQALQHAIMKGKSSGSDLVKAQTAVATATTPAQVAAATKRLAKAQAALNATEAQAAELQAQAQALPLDQALAAAETLKEAKKAQTEAAKAVTAAKKSGDGLADAEAGLAAAKVATKQAKADLVAATQAMDAYPEPVKPSPALGPSPATFKEEAASIAASMFASGPPPPGSGPTKSKTAFNLYDKRVAEHLASDTTFWVGSAWDQSLGRQISRTVGRAMKSGKGRTAAGLALALEADLAKFDKPSWYWETVASAAMVRARSVGSVAGFRAAGVQTFRFVNPGDERTSTICRALNGTIFSMRQAEGMLARAFANEDPEGHKEAWPWVPPSEATGKSADQLAARGIVLPPLHGRCRSRVVAHTFSTEFEPWPGDEDYPPDGTTPTSPAPGKAPTQSKPKREAVPQDAFPDDPDALEVVRKLGGSTGAELVKDGRGNLYVRKRGANPDHLREEVTADRIYQAAGVPVPPMKLYETQRGPVKLSRFIDGARPISDLPAAERAKAEAELRKHYALDAVMGNWDVVGATGDNVLVDAKGVPWRIDNGGSLRFRAQGERKDAGSWTRDVPELWAMRGKTSVPVSGPTRSAFGSLGWDHIEAQIQLLAERKEKILRDVPPDVRQVLAIRFESAEKLASAGQHFRASGWSEDYVDDVMRHTDGLRRAGVERLLPKEMKAAKDPSDPRRYSQTTFYDENGDKFDRLRGKKLVSGKLSESEALKRLKDYMAREGGDLETMVTHQWAQRGDSWAADALPAKYFWGVIARGRTDAQARGDFYWGEHMGVSYDAIKRGWERKPRAERDRMAATFAAYHAYTFMMLDRAKFEAKYFAGGGRKIKLWRTESVDLLKGWKKGQKHHLRRGAVESFSCARPYSYRGGELTYTEMPLSNVFISYWSSRRPGESGGALAGDHENEFVAMSPPEALSGPPNIAYIGRDWSKADEYLDPLGM